MNYADRKTGSEINTPDISEEKLNRILNNAKVDSVEGVTPHNIADVIKKIVKEYKTGEISLDEMSSAFNIIHGKTIYDNNFHEFNDVLETGSDLSYYERMTVNNTSVNNEFVLNLRTILNFGNK